MEETINRYAVGVKGERVVILLPPRELSKQEALLFAAWIVTLAEDEPGDFDRVRAAVEST